VIFTVHFGNINSFKSVNASSVLNSSTDCQTVSYDCGQIAFVKNFLSTYFFHTDETNKQLHMQDGPKK